MKDDDIYHIQADLKKNINILGESLIQLDSRIKKLENNLTLVKVTDSLFIDFNKVSFVKINRKRNGGIYALHYVFDGNEMAISYKETELLEAFFRELTNFCNTRNTI